MLDVYPSAAMGVLKQVDPDTLVWAPKAVLELELTLNVSHLKTKILIIGSHQAASVTTT